MRRTGRPPRYRDLAPDPWRAARRWFPPRITRATRALEPAGLCAERLSQRGALEALELLRARSRPLVTMTTLPAATPPTAPPPPQAQTLAGSVGLLQAGAAEQIQGLATIGRTSHGFHLLHEPHAGFGLFVTFVLDPLVQPNRDPQRLFRSTVGLALELAAVGEAAHLFLCPSVQRRGAHETVLWVADAGSEAA